MFIIRSCGDCRYCRMRSRPEGSAVLVEGFDCIHPDHPHDMHHYDHERCDDYETEPKSLDPTEIEEEILILLSDDCMFIEERSVEILHLGRVLFPDLTDEIDDKLADIKER